jgi:murein DD-endopeptidase MepM/ murein hydrolase activator NlpD
VKPEATEAGPDGSQAPRRKRRGWHLLWILPLAAYSFWPQPATNPVSGASARDWHPRSFWFEPWGASGVHKGIDIFAREGTPVVSPVSGIVVFSGELPLGGTVALVLTTGWRLHYFAHLHELHTRAGRTVTSGSPIGTVGSTGNAAGKPPHLHYSIVTAIPYPWRWDSSTQGWKKMFFLDPTPS